MQDSALVLEPSRPPRSRWHVLWTHSQCEQLVHDQLRARGLEVFLPKLNVWSRRAGLRHLVRRPMFPGYLFLHHAIDPRVYVEVRGSRGLVTILGEKWDRLAVVPDAEIEALQALSESGLPSMPHPYLKEGTRVRIAHGPLANVEGILTRRKDERGLLVLSVELLSRSVAVEVDCTAVVPA